jgi:hypothetical protein
MVEAGFVPEGQADSSQARSTWAAMQRGASRRDGRCRCQSEVYNPANASWRDAVLFGDSAQEMARASKIGSIVPLGPGYFPHNARHFVPGYYRAVPPEQKPDRGPGRLL